METYDWVVLLLGNAAGFCLLLALVCYIEARLEENRDEENRLEQIKERERKIEANSELYKKYEKSLGFRRNGNL